ncbi:MAG TPA: DUF934 domain-containing protein [Steroidobacteraceae bacterium]|nr:DUF934 domain-containing protein [Steroidobacteraceae bacterium]
MSRVLRQREIVADLWRVVDASTDPADAVLLPLARWLAEREQWLERAGPLGVRLGPADPVAPLAPDLDRLSLIAIEFGAIGEGRGYTQARVLRERYGYTGELRAVGRVTQDQIVFLARCGFDAFALDEAELESARAALDRYSVAYQRTDERLVRPRTRGAHARL